jgi:peptidoglycan hydrolase-like protein with peptidoglycan-binding domain
MTESPVDVKLKLPQLKPPPAPPPNQAATARVQHILNDIRKADHKPPIFQETGAFLGDTTRNVQEFQRKHGINPSGIVGPLTWQALLEDWAKLPPLPVELPPHPVE